jgi:hypothetical protein
MTVTLTKRNVGLLAFALVTALVAVAVSEVAVKSFSGFVLYFFAGELITTIYFLLIFALVFQTNGIRGRYVSSGIIVLVIVITFNALALQLRTDLPAWAAFGIWIPYFIIATIETSPQKIIKHRRTKPDTPHDG